MPPYKQQYLVISDLDTIVKFFLLLEGKNINLFHERSNLTLKT